MSNPGVLSITFEVLQRLARVESAKDIGEKLGLSEKTVANRQSMICEKLGVEMAYSLPDRRGSRPIPVSTTILLIGIGSLSVAARELRGHPLAELWYVETQ